MKSLKLFLLVTFLVSIFIGGCSTEKYISKEAGAKVKVDGRDNDWQNKTKYYKDQNMLIGIQNNNKNLYLLMETNDRQKIREIMGRGLIVWFDNSGGCDKKFGIKFPVGRNRMRNMGMQELEIYNPRTDSWDMVSFKEAKGIKIALSRNNGKLIYEMKISLHHNNNVYFLQPQKGKIGVGFATPKFTMKKNMGGRRDGEGSEMGMGRGESGEMGEGGMRGGRGGFGNRRSQRSNMPQPLKLWLSVSLSR